MFKEFDVDNNGSIDFQEFQAIMDSIFLDRQGIRAHDGWRKKVLVSLESRLRPPPPMRPVGLSGGRLVMSSISTNVKAEQECSTADILNQRTGRELFASRIVSPDEQVSKAVLSLRCSNLPDFRSRQFGKQEKPAFPCRPLAVLNVQDPRTMTWFKAGHSSWLDAKPTRMEFELDFDYFNSIDNYEICMYDLEDGTGG
ncbi:hypothetical protein GUITHDRAFT_113713 [Guillardia theta CCMP2712]|uniref:EF-hand domain-containing protein n=1 Tax=Guillardia theta (strain CCMP2712) TaxID=905079 RepID=L1IWI3_GUITC|nr:hypothetical protein GUITHDRAFT_113713 [Guillardia theta CCMP2712]EKX40234.1 hypothetical protein GUITHDRAFT_113713 [Guillardia theta CCMP2712]|eukprot:XP_005827214.1 hypothetical protein GUITHDRAFT_113713 [Guillardia theta CCMP2712]